MFFLHKQWLYSRSREYLVSCSWLFKHCQAWASSSEVGPKLYRQVFGHSYKFCAIIHTEYPARTPIVDQKFCDRTGVRVSLLIVCWLPFFTVEHNIQAPCRHQFYIFPSINCVGVILSNWALLSVFQNNPRLFGYLYRTPLANNSEIYNLIPPTESFAWLLERANSNSVSSNARRLHSHRFEEFSTALGILLNSHSIPHPNPHSKIPPNLSGSSTQVLPGFLEIHI